MLGSYSPVVTSYFAEKTLLIEGSVCIQFLECFHLTYRTIMIGLYSDRQKYEKVILASEYATILAEAEPSLLKLFWRKTL